MLKEMFTGTVRLARSICKRDRAALLVWVLGISLLVVGLAPYYASLYATAEERLIFAQNMANPVIIGIVGPVYGMDSYTSGALFSNNMLLFTGLFVAIMNVFLITKHTRRDEELGRMDVVRSMPVGRLSSTAAALLVALIANAAIILLTGLGIISCRVEGMDAAGSMTFAAALGSIGLFFAAVTSVICQLTSNNRTATGMSFLCLMFLYLIRAAGDIASNALSYMSPFGYMHMAESYVRNLAWPLMVIIGASAVITAFAFFFAKIRDLGQGLIPARRGRGTASPLLSNPLGLSLRLLRGSIWLWCGVIALLSVLFGSMVGEMENFVGNSETLKAVFTSGGYSVADEFNALLMAFLAISCAIPVLSIMLRIRSEEKAGHAEHVLSRSVSRTAQFVGYLAVAFACSVFFMLIASCGLGLSGAVTLETAPKLTTVIKAGLVYLPAIWAMLGITALLAGLCPRLTSSIYVYLGYSLFLVWFGFLMDLPEWMYKLMPFGHIPRIPKEQLNMPVLLFLTGIAIAATLIGVYGYRRRDTAFH